MKNLAHITWLTLLLLVFGNLACNDESTSRVPASNNNNGNDSDVGTNTDPGRSSDTFPQNTDFPPIDTNPVNTGDTNPVSTDDTNPVNTDDTNPVSTDDTNPVNTDDTNPVNTDDTNPPTGDCNDSNSAVISTQDWTDIPTSGLACFKLVPNDGWAYNDVRVKVENNSGVPVAGQAEVVGKSGYTRSHDFTPGSEVLKHFDLGRSNANSAAPYYIKITGSIEGQRIAWEHPSTTDPDPDTDDTDDPPTGDCNDSNSAVISTENWTDIPTSGLACFKLVPNDGWAYDDVRVKVENNSGVSVAGQAEVVGKSGYTRSHDFTPGSEVLKYFDLGRSNANSAAPYYIKITDSIEGQRIAWEYASTPGPDTDTTPEDTDPVTGDCNDSNSTVIPDVEWQWNVDIPASSEGICFKLVAKDHWAYSNIFIGIQNNADPAMGQVDIVGKDGYKLFVDLDPGSETIKEFRLDRSNVNSASPYYIKISGTTALQQLTWHHEE